MTNFLLVGNNFGIVYGRAATFMIEKNHFGYNLAGKVPLHLNILTLGHFATFPYPQKGGTAAPPQFSYIIIQNTEHVLMM